MRSCLRLLLKQAGVLAEAMGRGRNSPGARLLGMSDRFPHPLPVSPPEVSLLLRAHAEQRWLSREVAPVAQQIETGMCPRTGALLPAEQLPAALAYLEVAWLQAVHHAGESDGALTCLDLSLPGAGSVEARALATRARRYHATVLALRESLARRVALLLAPTDEVTVGATPSISSRR
jgi:hypothetical protein